MNIAEGQFSIKCNKCNKPYDYTAAEAQFNCITNSADKNKPENLYVWKHNFACSECNNKISFIYNVSEQPIGTLNKQDVILNGANLTRKFTFFFSENYKTDSK